MRHGVRIPTEIRDAMAQEAFCIAQEAGNRQKAIGMVMDRFEVADTTARNLINRGQFLAEPAKE